MLYRLCNACIHSCAFFFFQFSVCSVRPSLTPVQLWWLELPCLVSRYSTSSYVLVNQWAKTTRQAHYHYNPMQWLRYLCWSESIIHKCLYCYVMSPFRLLLTSTFLCDFTCLGSNEVCNMYMEMGQDWQSLYCYMCSVHVCKLVLVGTKFCDFVPICQKKI